MGILSTRMDPEPSRRVLRSSSNRNSEANNRERSVDLVAIEDYDDRRNADSVYFLRWFYNPDDDDYDELDDTEDDYDDTEGDDDDSYDDMVNIHFDGIPMRRSIPHPRTDLKPNTTKLKNSDFYLLMQQNAGLRHNKAKERPNSVLQMIQARQTGMFGADRFTAGDQAKISSSYFPTQLNHIIKHNQKLFCGVYSNDGSRFISACQDCNITLYNSERDEFKPISTITGRDVSWSILDAVFSPDNNFIAYSSWCDSVHLVPLNKDPEDQISLSSCSGERRFCIFSLAYAADGQNIIGGANDGNIYICHLERDKHTRIKAHSRDVNAVSYADDSSHILYSAGDDGLCKVWDTRTLNENSPKPVGILAGHLDGITYIDSRQDRRHLITNSKDQSIKLWDIRIFSSADALNKTEKAISSHAWDYRFQKAPKKFCKNVKSLEGDSSVMTYRGHSVLQTLIRCRFSPAFSTGQRYIYTGCASGQTVIYDALTGEIAAALTGHSACVRDVSWHPYRNELCSTAWDNIIMNWDSVSKMSTSPSRMQDLDY
ncbi:DDB1- and CUL4-associated factor 11 isoform X2 [Bemisia tabaci]|uniref:DDB1- and CUL4-associated factor 11 isoform X2 n=1 Tax=Bemisia tabaci TaxID=7038 RepID=UPI003B289187